MGAGRMLRAALAVCSLAQLQDRTLLNLGCS